MYNLPFAVPDIGEEEIAEVVDCLRSGWITTGPKTRRFEADFVEFLGDPSLQALAVNSATSGLHLALEACGVGPGDEVITSPYTFTSTAEVIRYLAADPVFVDIDRRTRNIDVNKIEAAITPKTKVIMPVHIGGFPADMDVVLDIARRYKLKVVEDAAHALPTTYHGQLVGTLGSDATVFSFYATKTITTAEGGMIVSRNEEIIKRASIMRLHGIDRDAFDRYTSDKPAWYYQIVAPGYKYNMTDISAAIGIHQLKKAYRFQERRQSIAETYDKAFSRLPISFPPRITKGEFNAWHLYIIEIPDDFKLSRDEVVVELSKLGVGTSVHFIPLHMHPYWKNTYHLDEANYPNATSAYKCAVSLPIYTKMSDDDVQRVIDAVIQVLS